MKDSGGSGEERVQIRTIVYIDRMQPQYAAITGTVSTGDVPIEGMSELYLEIAPGVEVYRALDLALKTTEVKPGMEIVEREFGVMEIHADSQSAILEAARAIMSSYGISEADRKPAQVVSTQIVTRIDPYQCQLINKMRRGSLLLPGESFYIMEVSPAGYVTYAANEAEKAANIKVLDFRPVGKYGRLYIGGPEAEVEAAKAATVQAIEGLAGMSLF